MATSPKIAIVITCFNYATYVGEAIQSVLDQNSRDCELVVVDDGSTDESWAVIQSTGVSAFRIANGGQRAACLYGLNKTRAPFVLFLDADDTLSPGAIEQILAHLDPDVAKLQFCLTCIDATGHVIADPYPALGAFRDRGRIVDEILSSGVYQTPPTSGNVFRRDVCAILSQCDYDKAVDGVILQAAPFLGDLVSLSHSLGVYRVHGQNDSGLGRVPQAVTFERDLQRFQARMAHLRALIGEIRPGSVLVATEDTYYFQFTRFCAATLRGTRSAGRSVLRLLRAIVTEPRRRRWRIATALFVLAAALAPMRQAQTLIVFRLSVGRRSIPDFFRLMYASKQGK